MFTELSRVSGLAANPFVLCGSQGKYDRTVVDMCRAAAQRSVGLILESILRWLSVAQCVPLLPAVS